MSTSLRHGSNSDITLDKQQRFKAKDGFVLDLAT